MAKISPERIRKNIEERGLKCAYKEFLKDLISYYCSYKEISDILNEKAEEISAFLHEKRQLEIENIEGSKIYELIKSLTDPSIYQPKPLRKSVKSYESLDGSQGKRKKKLTIPEIQKYREQRRTELSNDCDPDMVLMAFGFLPIESQVIRVDCPARRQKILNLVDTLDSGLINDDQFMSLSQIIEEQVALLCQESKDQGLKDIKYIKEWIDERAKRSLASPFNKEYIKNEFIKSLESRDLKYKTDFKEIEYVSLYRSIVTKALRRNQIFRERNFLLKVKNIYFEPKYIHIEKPFYELIRQTIRKENMANAVEGLEQRVLKVSVELEIYVGGSSEGVISLQSASTSTYLGNLQSVITRGLGSALQFPSCTFRVRALGQSLESLVDGTSVISRPFSIKKISVDETLSKQAAHLTQNSERKKDFQFRYWGQWVGRDTFLALAQSLTVALEDGIYDLISEMTEKFPQKNYSEDINANLQYYYKTIIDISTLKNKVQLQLFYEKPFTITDSVYLQQLIEDIEKTIDSIFKHIRNNNYSDIYRFMLASLYRIYGLVNLELFRFNFLIKDGKESIKLLIKNSKFYFKEKIRSKIDMIEDRKYRRREVDQLDIVVDDWLKPISWLYDAEALISQFLTQRRILSENCDLSRSLNDVWNDNSFGNFLNLQPSEDDYQHSYYKYTSPDIYIGLSELLGRLGQLRYYLALPPKSKDLCHLPNAGFTFSTDISLRDQLTEAQRFLLLAAGYASRTGNAHRMAHWMLLCYRATMRLDNDINPLIQEAKLLNQVRKYLKVEYHIPSLKIIEGAFKAEHFLTLGEALLIRSQNHNGQKSRKRLLKAGELLIQSLLSAVYIKLNLRLADSLYILGKAAYIFSFTTISVQEVVDRLPNLYKHVLALSLTVPNTTLAQDSALHCLRLFMPFEQYGIAIDLHGSNNINSRTSYSRYPDKSSYDEERESWQKHYTRLNNAAQGIWNSWTEDSGGNHFISTLISKPNSPFLSHISFVDE